MSAPPLTGPGAGKKAVHVKWAGKTIALGTFPSAEADEKCAKAKALTRAWRSSMRPKPSREWVMLELETLGVRVVSGRLGRKAEDGEDQPASSDKKATGDGVGVGSMVGGAGGMERNPSLGWGNEAELTNLAARRNSSLGLSMMNDTMARRGSLGSLGQVMGLDADPTMPPHRPFVGGGAAAAYEAARHDHFTQKSAEQQRRASSLGLGSLTNGSLGGMGMSVNPNQHYEMLKLHHMNLLNEIQETTLMMNLYQQQQLQQQQQQLQQQQASEHLGGGAGSDSQLSMLMQQNSVGAQSMDSLFGNPQLQHRGSLGLGSSQMGNFGGPNGLQGAIQGNIGSGVQGSLHNSMQNELQNSLLQHSGALQGGLGANRTGDDLQGRVQSIKNEIRAGGQVSSPNLTSNSGGSMIHKRGANELGDDLGEDPAAKRLKQDNVEPDGDNSV